MHPLHVAGDKKIMVKTARQGQLMLYNMAAKKMISRPLLHSLKTPLSQVEDALRQDATNTLTGGTSMRSFSMLKCDRNRQI